MRIAAREVFATDFTDLDAVIALAERLGKGMSVVKHHDRPNYNITHTSRKDLLQGVQILHQT